MTFFIHRSERSRHLILRGAAGEILPEALIAVLDSEQVTCGWLRASGVLADIELRAFNEHKKALGETRLIAGPTQVLTLEGSVGLASGSPSVSLRALLARDTDRGLETLAGEVTRARTVALEVFVTVLEDLSLTRTLDPTAGIWLLGSAPSAAAEPAVRTWSGAVEASTQADRDAGRSRPAAASTQNAASSTGTGVTIPQRPVRPHRPTDPPGLVPEAGDIVEHFAFGRCEVVRSEGDRLHLRVPKDGRVKEIALEMLRVTRLDESEAGPHRFKLERRL